MFRGVPRSLDEFDVDSLEIHLNIKLKKRAFSTWKRDNIEIFTKPEEVLIHISESDI